jgi:hypothetical protein
VIQAGSIFRATAMVRSGEPGMIMRRKAMVAAIAVVAMLLRRIGVLQGVPFQHLRPLEEDADGQRRA